MEVPRHWRLKKQRYELVGEVCPHCKRPSFPPRSVCPYCSEEAHRALEIREQPAFILEERVTAVHA